MAINKTKILILLFVLFFCTGRFSSAQKLSEIDSLKQALQTTKEKNKPEILNKLCWKLRNSHPKESVQYGEESIKLSEKYNLKGELAKAYSFTGVAYRNLGSYIEAFDKYFTGLSICRKYNLTEYEGYALINIGNVYIYQEAYEDAVSYLTQASVIAKKIKNKKMIAYCNLNLGRALLLQKEYEKALAYFQTALTIRKELKHIEGISVCYKYIADTYLEQNKLDKAFNTYNISLNAVMKQSDWDLFSNIYERLAKTTLLQYKINQSKDYAKKSLDIATEVNNKFRIRNSYKMFYEINFKLKKFKKALEYLNLVVAYNDTLFNKRLVQKIASMEFSSMKEKKQSEIDLLNKEKKIKELDAKRKKEFRNVLIVTLVLITIIMILSIIFGRKLKYNNQTLNNQKQELEKSLSALEKLNQQFFAKNLEIEQRNTEIKSYSKQVGEQKEKIEIAHENITQSINYAKKIQQALLPNLDLMNKLLPDYFILYKPKENVSGDFYYVNQMDKNLIFAVADCTGHGVPGAFMTMLGVTFLHGIVKRREVNDVGNVLSILRTEIKEIFTSFGTENVNGLDIALCVINTETNILQYSGAYSPLYIIRNNKLSETKAVRNPIGFYPKEKDFITHKIQLENNDMIYIFSDGFQDQFSAKTGRPFTKTRFKNLIMKAQNLPVDKQKIIMQKTLDEWKGNSQQIDDITILGIKWKM